MAWLKVFVIGLFLQVPVKLLAPVAVFFVDRKTHPIFGLSDATDLSWWNVAIRNGGGNFLNRPRPEFITKGNTDDETLEKLSGFQWRLRTSIDGEYVSFRCTWGEPRASKGKREFYIGWIMNEKPIMNFTFFQLRLF